jgi:hypothetical protein
MSKNFKHATSISIILVATLLISLSAGLLAANAQTDTATVIIQPSTGGTTDPSSGTYTYTTGQTMTLTAIPNDASTFQYWIISGDLAPGQTGGSSTNITNPSTGEIISVIAGPEITGLHSAVIAANPINLAGGFGYIYSYQAVFQSTAGSTPSGLTGIVDVLQTIGGTVSPAPGQYVYADGQKIVLSATANSGYKFQHWIASGNYINPNGHFAYLSDGNGTVIAQLPTSYSNLGLDTLTFTSNPAYITCGYGYTYTYTAVFSPTTTTPTPTPTPTVTPTNTPTATPQATTPPTATPTTAPTTTPTAIPPTTTPTAVPTTSTPTASPVAPSDMTTTYVIVAVAIIIIIIVAIAAVMMRRKK